MLRETELRLQLPKPGQQYVIFCDASYKRTGFVLLVEDYGKENNTGEKRTYAPVSFGSRLFTSPQLKFSVYYKDVLALYFALDHFANYIWHNNKPVMNLTDNKNFKQFFQAKSIPPNYAANFFSRMETDQEAQFSLHITKKLPVNENEIESEAKTPDVSLNTIEKFIDTFKEEDEIDLAMVEKLRELRMYVTYLTKKEPKPKCGKPEIY